jgi:WD40-like Beta Propeller Repeat
MDSILKHLAVAFTLCILSVLGATEDFPLKRVPLLTYVVDYEASWSPDGRQIVLISNRHGGMKAHVLDASSDGNGSDMRQITTGPNEDDSPAWSPDSRQIAFVSVHGDVSDIFVMNADGSNVRQVTRGLGQNIHPMWSPDSSRILFNTTYFAGQGQKDDKTSDESRVIGENRDDSIDPPRRKRSATHHSRGWVYLCVVLAGRKVDSPSATAGRSLASFSHEC